MLRPSFSVFSSSVRLKRLNYSTPTQELRPLRPDLTVKTKGPIMEMQVQSSAKDARTTQLNESGPHGGNSSGTFIGRIADYLRSLDCHPEVDAENQMLSFTTRTDRTTVTVCATFQEPILSVFCQFPVIVPEGKRGPVAVDLMRKNSGAVIPQFDITEDGRIFMRISAWIRSEDDATGVFAGMSFFLLKAVDDNFDELVAISATGEPAKPIGFK